MAKNFDSIKSRESPSSQIKTNSRNDNINSQFKTTQRSKLMTLSINQLLNALLDHFHFWAELLLELRHNLDQELRVR